MLQKIFLGNNPQTSIAGYLLAGLYAIQDCSSKGFIHWYQFVVPVSIAILGRVAGDSKNTVNNQ